jgi:hypothetical protein
VTPTAALMLEAWMDLWLACWGWERRRNKEGKYGHGWTTR